MQVSATVYFKTLLLKFHIWLTHGTVPRTSDYFHCFFSEVIVLGMLWVRTRNSEQLMW